MFDNDLLRAFVTVAEDGGFTRAAERLSLTQSAVSAQIKRLELQAGCALLSRNTRSVTLTVQGEVLLDYARNILALHESARLRLGAARTAAGSMRIGVSEGLFDRELAATLQMFKSAHASIELSLQVGITGALLEAWRNGHLDVVLGITCGPAQDGETLWSDQLVWACAPSALLEPTQPIPVAFFPEPCPYRAAALAALNASRVPWRLACVSPSAAGVKTAAACGLGVAPLLRSQLERDLHDVGATLGLPALPVAQFAVWTSQQSPAARQFLQAIRDGERLRNSH